LVADPGELVEKVGRHVPPVGKAAGERQLQEQPGLGRDTPGIV